MDNKLSLMAGRVVPKFVREEYPQFMNFVKGYFEYLERDGGEYAVVAEMMSAVDIDRTADEYLHYYRNEVLPGFPDRMAVDAKFLIKKIKDFYQAKGTEESFEFLFRTLFDSPVTFYYPKVDMLRVSEGAWIEPYYIFPTKLNASDPNPDLFALRDQKIQGTQSGATAYIDARILVTVPQASDPDLVRLKFGSSLTELQGDFIAGETCKVISSRFDDAGNPLPTLPNFKILETFEGKSGIIRPAGRYVDRQGFLSDTKKIQDSYYYQDFSYELISEIPVKFYDQVIKRLVHPAGFAMFGKVEVKSIDVISLRDLVTYFEILISWENILVDAGLVDTGSASPILVHNTPTEAKSQRIDWNHFVDAKETNQYDVLRIDELDEYTFDELDDLRGRNYHMVFVNNRKVPYTQYETKDREITFTTAPSVPPFSNSMLAQNIEILHTSYSTQEPMVFDADGVNVEYDLNDNLNITESNIRYVVVFIDGLFKDYGLHYSIVKNRNNRTKWAVVFKSILPVDTTVDISVLGGDLIPGSRYAPQREYTNVPASTFSKPFKMRYMPDNTDAKNFAVFGNGQKIPHNLAYSIIRDINTDTLLANPRVAPSDMGISGNVDLSSFIFKSGLIDADLHTGDGTRKVFPMSISHNHFDIQQSAVIDEHEYPKPTVGQHDVSFTRTSTATSDNFNNYPIWHDFMSYGQTELSIDKDFKNWEKGNIHRVYENSPHGVAERFDSITAYRDEISMTGNWRKCIIPNNEIPDGKYITFQMWVYQSTNFTGGSLCTRYEGASRNDGRYNQSQKGKWQLIKLTYKHEPSNSDSLSILSYAEIGKNMSGYMLVAAPKVFVHDKAVPDAPSNPAKLYMNITIDERSIFFNNWAIQAEPNGLLTEANKIDNLNAGKYLYNKTFTINDVSKPLNLQVGHMRGSIDDITLSIIDD